MLFGRDPEWCIDGRAGNRIVMTNVNHWAFHSACRRGNMMGLEKHLRTNGLTQVKPPDEALEVLQGMLRENPSERLSTGEILNHPWLAYNEDES